MKTHVFVLVPYDVPPTDIPEFVEQLLQQSCRNPDDPAGGRWDGGVGPLARTLNDPIAEGRLPPKVRRTFSGNICDRCRLPPGVVPGALVTPDGKSHDLGDFGWRMVKEPCEANRIALDKWTARFNELMSEHEQCYVVEVWMRS